MSRRQAVPAWRIATDIQNTGMTKTIPSVVGLVLAGGRSQRMGGRDKAGLMLCGETLLARSLRQLAPQVDRVAVSRNAPGTDPVGVDLPMLPDLIPGHLGPLAGIHAGLSRFPDCGLIAVAVDLAAIPPDLVARLRASDATCAYASDGRGHALALWWAPGQAEALGRYLQQGGRSVHQWLTRHGQAVVFDRPGDIELFCNLNTPDDLAEAERRLCGT